MVAGRWGQSQVLPDLCNVIHMINVEEAGSDPGLVGRWVVLGRTVGRLLKTPDRPAA